MVTQAVPSERSEFPMYGADLLSTTQGKYGPPAPLDRTHHIKSASCEKSRNHKANAPPIVAPAIAMTTEMNGSCSTGEAELDPVDGVEVDAEEDADVCVFKGDVLC